MLTLPILAFLFVSECARLDCPLWCLDLAVLLASQCARLDCPLWRLDLAVLRRCWCRRLRESASVWPGRRALWGVEARPRIVRVASWE